MKRQTSEWEKILANEATDKKKKKKKNLQNLQAIIQLNIRK